MAWMGNKSVGKRSDADVDEIVSEANSTPLRRRKIQTRDLRDETIAKTKLVSSLQSEITTATTTSADALSRSITVGATLTADATLSGTDSAFHLVDTASGTVTVTLQPAATMTNKTLSFKKIVAANSMILDGNGSETIDGATTKSLSDRWSWVTIISNGTNWFILSLGNP
jgi:hypothetical protein